MQIARRRALVAGAAALGLPAARAARASAEPIGRVARLAGTARSIRGDAIVALTEGDPLYLSDIIRTAPDAKLLLVTADGLEVTIGGDTELALRTYLVAPGGGITAYLGVLKGIIRMVTRGGSGRPHRIEVDTPTALASVRGTVWVVEAVPGSTGAPASTGVLALEGIVAVRGLAGDEEVRLGPGQGTDVVAGRPPKAAASWGAPRRELAVRRTTL